MEAVTRKFLDKAQCMAPGCTHKDHAGLFLHGRCHVGAGNDVVHKNGVVHVACTQCERPVVDVSVWHEQPFAHFGVEVEYKNGTLHIRDALSKSAVRQVKVTA